jgi:Flp pilus assembly protein TadD
MYRDLGRTAEAVRLLREAVSIDPASASYWNSLGMILGGSGELDEAERAFEEAVHREPQNAQYLYNRGIALQRLDRSSDAAESFRRAATLGFAPARSQLARLRTHAR